MKDLRIALAGIIGVAAIGLVALKPALAQDAQVPIGGGAVHMKLGANNPAAHDIKYLDNPAPNEVMQFYLQVVSDDIWQEEEEQARAQIPVPGEATDATLTDVTCSNTGTSQASDWTNMKLWRDFDADGDVDMGTDTLLATSNSPNISFTGLNVLIPKDGTKIHFIISCDVAQTAVPDRTVRIRIVRTDVKLTPYTNPALDSSIEGNSHTIKPSMSNVALGAGPNVPAGQVFRGSVAAPILQFVISADSTGIAPVITSVIISPAAGNTATVADVVRMRIFRETGTPNGVVDGTDAQLGNNGVPLAGFKYQFGFTDSVPVGGSATYLVVCDVASSATLGNIFKFSTQQTDIQTEALWQGGVPSVTEDNRTIADPLATSLAVVVQPTNATAGQTISAITVEARLPGGGVDTSFTGQITATLETAPTGGVFTPSSTVNIVASGGVAQFVNLAIQKAGTYRIQFVSPPVPTTPSALTEFFDIIAGNANSLHITVQPINGTVGVPLPPPPVVEARDLYGNVATGYSGTVTAELVSNPGQSNLVGHQVAAVNGVVTYSGLYLNKVGDGYTLKFTAPGLVETNPPSNSFNMTHGAPYAIQIIQQPSNTTGGMVITPHPSVRVVDIGLNPVLNHADDITVAIGNNPNGGTLTGTTAQAPSSAVATFNDLKIDKAGVGYTLVFSTLTLNQASIAFNIGVGQPTQLVVVQQPTDSTGGVAFPQQPVVQVQDQGGNLVTTDSNTQVQATITAGTGEPGAVLSGPTTLQVVGGVATYSGLSINKAGLTAYTLTFTPVTLPAYTPAISQTFTISVGAAAKVGLVTQPGMATMGAPFVQQPVAQIEDLGGNRIVGSTAFVTVHINTAVSPPGSTLMGTAGVTAQSGVATFTNLAIDLPNIGFVLTFESNGLASVDSVVFDVASTATQLGLLVEPGQGVIDAPLSVQPIVEIRDAMGVLVSLDNYTTVTAQILAGTGAPGATLTGNTSVVAVNGRATFTNLKISTQGLSYHLRFTCVPSLTSVDSVAFHVAGVPVRAVVTRQPVGAEAGEPLSVQPQVTILDSNNIPVFNNNTTWITAYVTPATGTPHAILGGTVTVPSQGGVAEFTDLSIDRPGQNYTLTFSATPVLQHSTSASFDIGGSAPPPAGGGNVNGSSAGGGCSPGGQAAPWLLLALMFVALGGAALRRARN